MTFKTRMRAGQAKERRNAKPRPLSYAPHVTVSLAGQAREKTTELMDEELFMGRSPAMIHDMCYLLLVVADSSLRLR